MDCMINGSKLSNWFLFEILGKNLKSDFENLKKLL